MPCPELPTSRLPRTFNVPSVAPAVSRFPKLVIAGWLAVVIPPLIVTADKLVMLLTAAPLNSTAPTSTCPVWESMISFPEPEWVIIVLVSGSVIFPPTVIPCVNVDSSSATKAPTLKLA